MRELTFDEIQTATGGQTQCTCIAAITTTDCSGAIDVHGAIKKMLRHCSKYGYIHMPEYMKMLRLEMLPD